MGGVHCRRMGEVFVTPNLWAVVALVPDGLPTRGLPPRWFSPKTVPLEGASCCDVSRQTDRRQRPGAELRRSSRQAGRLRPPPPSGLEGVPPGTNTSLGVAPGLSQVPQRVVVADHQPPGVVGGER